MSLKICAFVLVSLALGGCAASVSDVAEEPTAAEENVGTSESPMLTGLAGAIAARNCAKDPSSCKKADPKPPCKGELSGNGECEPLPELGGWPTTRPR